jgi:hypothetical protein
LDHQEKPHFKCSLSSGVNLCNCILGQSSIPLLPWEKPSFHYIQGKPPFFFISRGNPVYPVANLPSTVYRKKSFSVFPSPAGMSLSKLSLGENYDVISKLFLLSESFVSDIPARYGKIEKFFYGVYSGH